MSVSHPIRDLRVPASIGRVRVREERMRYLVALDVPDVATRRALIADFKLTFPGHGDRYWRALSREWSLPLRHRARLQAWLWIWFEAEAIHWS